MRICDGVEMDEVIDSEVKDYELDEDELDEGSGYRIKLSMFEGPLDLLLHLIKRAKIRICDIFVSDITRQFLEHIENIGEEDLDIDKASEFLGMAAYLLEIKAKSLLPKPETPTEGEEEDDGSELIRRLEEYELYKKETEKVIGLESVDVFFRDPDRSVGDERTDLKDMTMEGLFAALRKIFERVEKRSLDRTPKEIVRDPFTVEEKTTYIRARLDSEKKLMFAQLFSEYPTVNEVITTFQALLELMKLQYLTAEQTETFGDIALTKLDDTTAV